MDQTLVGIIGSILFILSGTMFFVSLRHTTQKNPKWLLFMSFGLIFLYAISLFLGIANDSNQLPLELVNKLVTAQFVFSILALLFFLAFLLNRDKKT